MSASRNNAIPAPTFDADAHAAGAAARLDDVNGFPLGIRPQVGSGETTVKLAPGHTLLLYTDGITDAASPDSGFFGLEGIERAIIDCDGEPGCVIGRVLEAIKAHERGLRPRDDRTLVALQARGH